MNNFEKQIFQLKSENCALRYENSQLKSDLQAILQLNKELREENKQLKQEIKKLKIKVSKLKTELEKYKVKPNNSKSPFGKTFQTLIGYLRSVGGMTIRPIENLFSQAILNSEGL